MKAMVYTKYGSPDVLHLQKELLEAGQIVPVIDRRLLKGCAGWKTAVTGEKS